MAERPETKLSFYGKCPDCGERNVLLPAPLPPVGDDFDWLVRDYTGFRQFMLEELAARLPGRKRWTPADMEVVIIEALAAVLDQLSDMLDRISAEAYLETARRPDSLQKLLQLIGYETTPEQLQEPAAREAARRAGPLEIHTQQRMVTVADYAQLLEEHPLVARANSWLEWGGAWSVVHIAVIPWDDRFKLDTEGIDYSEIKARVETFHTEKQLPAPFRVEPTIRSILHYYLETYRMAGREVILEDILPVGIVFSLSVKISDDFFQSEIRYAVEQALGRGPGGFFESGRLKFGEDIHLGDIVQTLMKIDGIINVCVNRFKRVGSQYFNMAAAGSIKLDGLEIGVCDNDPAHPDRGYYYLKIHGGRKG